MKEKEEAAAEAIAAGDSIPERTVVTGEAISEDSDGDDKPRASARAKNAPPPRRVLQRNPRRRSLR